MFGYSSVLGLSFSVVFVKMQLMLHTASHIVQHEELPEKITKRKMSAMMFLNNLLVNLK
jgi:hypothetical protein